MKRAERTSVASTRKQRSCERLRRDGEFAIHNNGKGEGVRVVTSSPSHFLSRTRTQSAGFERDATSVERE